MQSQRLLFLTTHLKSQLKWFKEGRVYKLKIILINKIKDRYIKKNLKYSLFNRIKRKMIKFIKNKRVNKAVMMNFQ